MKGQPCTPNPPIETVVWRPHPPVKPLRKPPTPLPTHLTPYSFLLILLSDFHYSKSTYSASFYMGSFPWKQI